MMKKNTNQLNLLIYCALAHLSLAVLTSTARGDENPARAERLEGTVRNRSQTSIDFNETLIEGKMQAPNGFFIEGRRTQSMTQMVKLRSNFREKLLQSKYAVRAIVK
jgi:hypothetical protein